MEKKTVRMRVNGKPCEVSVEPRKLLADVLREDLGLTGTHVGCEHGVCGACTIQLDGEAVRSCLMFGVQADGAELATVEGLAQEGQLSALQDSFSEHHALQCGFCTAGILMSLDSYMREHPRASESELRVALSGNLCRCTGYRNIVRAACAVAGVSAKKESDG
ncbi:MAG TPA: (2Fe-2S)-binding protein [Ramlibacter sp.]|jgi:aerobic-type carbon monoxide dehydrogenase small subunit (CoxS/CutS family)|nr:(2Fe-2S)-binding protein [Ramlibacter sp.]